MKEGIKEEERRQGGEYKHTVGCHWTRKHLVLVAINFETNTKDKQTTQSKQTYDESDGIAVGRFGVSFSRVARHAVHCEARHGNELPRGKKREAVGGAGVWGGVL